MEKPPSRAAAIMLKFMPRGMFDAFIKNSFAFLVNIFVQIGTGFV